MFGRELARKLKEAGVIEDDLNDTERLIIDIRANEAVRVYVQRFLPERAHDALIEAVAGLVAKHAED
jgi:hypothetical protein